MNWWRQFKAAWVMRRSLDLALLDRATALIRQAEVLEGSGEYKRHQVYARLIKEYPTRSRTELALAIEVALCGL